MKMTTLRMALCVGLLSAGGGASAIQYTWDLNKPYLAGGYTDLSFTSGGKTLTVTAYETSQSDGTGKLLDAKVTADGAWGLGVLGSGDSGYPDTYTVDNAGKDEVLVFDAGTDNFDWNSLKLGFIMTGTGYDASPDLKYWAGNGSVAGFDFNNYCLSATTCTGGTVLGGSAGFTGPSNLPGVTANTSIPLTTNNTGRYLVVSGQLSTSDGFEKFKISSAGGYGTNPEPQSMALIGIGLLAMLGLRRRSSIARGRRTEIGFA